MIELQDIITTKRELLSRETCSRTPMKELKDQMASMQSKHAYLENQLSEEHKLRKSAERKIKSLQEKLDYANQERFGDRRQRIKSKAKTVDSDRNKEKDDYDGTDDTLRADSVGHVQSP